MHGFHCREAVQPGCNLSPALTLLPGQMAPACAAAPEHRLGAILHGPPTEARASGGELQALTPKLCFHVHKYDQSEPPQMGNPLTNGEAGALIFYHRWILPFQFCLYLCATSLLKTPQIAQ